MSLGWHEITLFGLMVPSWIGQVLVLGALAGATTAIYRGWVRPVIERFRAVIAWFQHQGEVHEQVLGELTGINGTLADHELRITDVERTLRGSAPTNDRIPMTPRVRRDDT